jgi:hypothetical protein
MNKENLDQGYQILLEYVHFNDFNLVPICQPYDEMKNGLIDNKNFS